MIEYDRIEFLISVVYIYIYFLIAGRFLNAITHQTLNIKSRNGHKKRWHSAAINPPSFSLPSLDDHKKR